MTKKIIPLLKLYLNHIKRDLILCYISILSVFLFSAIFSVAEDINLILLILLFIFNLKIISNYSFHPGNKSTNIDSFNWKYLFNLPLSLNEKVLLFIGIDIITFSHFYLFILLFAKKIASILDITNYLPNYPLLLIVLILLTIFHTLSVLTTAWSQPKRQMQKFSALSNYIYIIRMIAAFGLGLMLIYFIIYYANAYSLITTQQIVTAFKTLFVSFITWPLLIYLSLINYHLYSIFKSDAKNEILNYIPPKQYNIPHNAKFIFIYIIIGTLILKYYWHTNFYYEDLSKKSQSEAQNYIKMHKNKLNKNKGNSFSPIQAIIHGGNVDFLKLALNNGALLQFEYTNKENFHDGFTATYFAIDSDKLEMVKYLESIGFNFTQKSTRAKFYPIHLAFRKCNPEIINYFIEKKYDLEIQNEDGETPLIVALRTNCLYGVIKLKDEHVNTKALNKKKEDFKSYIKKFITNEERVAIYNYLLNQKE